jgi:hypothetical protein
LAHYILFGPEESKFLFHSFSFFISLCFNFSEEKNLSSIMGKKIFNKLKQVFTLGTVLGHKANGQGLENLFVKKKPSKNFQVYWEGILPSIITRSG